MGLIDCPDCGKSISDIAPSCIQCGRPMTAVNFQKSPPKININKDLANEHAENFKTQPSSLFKILAGVISLIVTAVLAGIVSAVTGEHRPHNMIWTFWWIWLTIVSCKAIGFKSLLYYPAFIAISIAITAFARSIGSPITYMAGNIIANFGGLILFYSSYRRAINQYKNDEKYHIKANRTEDFLEKNGTKNIEKQKHLTETSKEFQGMTGGGRTLSINTKPTGMSVLINGKHMNDVTPLMVSTIDQEFTIDFVYKNTLIASKEYNTTKTGLSVFENFSEILHREYNVEPGLRRCLKCLKEFRDFDDKCPTCGSARLTVPI